MPIPNNRIVGFDIFVFSIQKFDIEELQNARESESKYKQQHVEALKREKMLIRRLAAKEQEMQEYVVKFGSILNRTSTRAKLLDMSKFECFFSKISESKC